jgi:hypothetical protein
MSDAKKEPVSNKRMASVATLPPQDSSSSNEIRNREKEIKEKHTKVGTTGRR